MKKIKAVIFDMDGVLIDAKEWHFDALNMALSTFGFEITRTEHLSKYDGLPTKKKVDMLNKDKGFPIELLDFINDLKQKFTSQIIATECKPVFTHQYALSKLQKEGYKLSVASNSVRKSVQTMLDVSAIIDFFDFYMSNEDVKQPKPNPEMYIKSIDKHGLKPEEVLILEDNHHGKQAAISSGAHLLEIDTIFDVNFKNITDRIREIENA